MKEKSANEKVGIAIIVILISILIIIIVLYLLGVFNKKAKEADIVVDNTVMFKYSKKKWDTVDSKLYENYNWNKYSVYSDNKYLGRYDVVNMMDKWYVFTDDRTSVDVSGDKLYLGGEIKAKLSAFKKEKLTSDMVYVHSVLDYYKISRDDQNNYTFGYKVKFDFDDDGKKEELFVISNMFSSRNVDSSYSFMFIRDNDKTKMIYNNVSSGDKNLTGCYAYLFSVIKVEDTKSFQMIMKCSHYSTEKAEYGLYQYQNNNVELLLYNK